MILFWNRHFIGKSRILIISNVQLNVHCCYPWRKWRIRRIMVHSGFHSWILSYISDLFAYDFMCVMGTFSLGSLNPRSLSAGMKPFHSPRWNICLSFVSVVLTCIYMYLYVIMYEMFISQLGCLSTCLSHLNTPFSFPEVMQLSSLLSPNTLNQQFSTVGCHPLWVCWVTLSQGSDTLHIRYWHHDSQK